LFQSFQFGDEVNGAMGQILKIGTCILGLFFGSVVPGMSADNPSDGLSPDKIVELQVCTDDKLRVKFLCNPDWALETEADAMLIVISEDPAVTMTIAKSKSPVIFLGQLTKEALQEMGQYAEGFSQEKAKLASGDAIKVQGFSREFPEIRLLDYYLLHDLSLYSVLFSVNPKEKFDDFGPLLNQIADSFGFLE